MTEVEPKGEESALAAEMQPEKVDVAEDVAADKEGDLAGREDVPLIEKEELDLKKVVVGKRKFTEKDAIKDTGTEIEIVTDAKLF